MYCYGVAGSVAQLVDQGTAWLDGGTIRRIDITEVVTCPHVNDIRGDETNIGEINGDPLGSIYPARKHFVTD